MATFNVPATNIQANVLATSPGVIPLGKFNHAEIQLTDPNNQWGATPDPTRHVVVWGLQQSTDNGNTWAWGPVMQQEPNGGLPFGSRDRSGGMPQLTVDRSDIPSGVRLRLAILTDANIRLGATVNAGA